MLRSTVIFAQDIPYYGDRVTVKETSQEVETLLAIAKRFDHVMVTLHRPNVEIRIIKELIASVADYH